MGMDAKKTIVPVEKIDELFDKAISDGVVLDNNLPTNVDGWYRAWVTDSYAIIRMLSQVIGEKIVAKELKREFDPVGVSAPPGTTHTAIWWYTKRGGKHFTLVTPGTKEIIYNPWKEIELTDKIYSIRHWSVT
jgi:hypothetical protein